MNPDELRINLIPSLFQRKIPFLCKNHPGFNPLFVEFFLIISFEYFYHLAVFQYRYYGSNL